MKKVLKFGYDLRHEMFCLDPTKFFTNHGSYGAVSKPVLEKRFELLLEQEKSPDKWFRFTRFELYNKSVDSLANYLKIKQLKNLVLCENATESINVALRSIKFNGSSDAILATSYTYKAILNAINFTAKYRFNKNNKIKVFVVDIKFPIKNINQLLNQFENKIKEIVNEKKLRLRLAVIDSISCPTGMRYPVDDINKIIRKLSKESLILVDGAHDIGLLDL
jgi:selenocysteine lyase/cysteine desulfurase